MGPRIGEENEPGKLASATRASLNLAEQHGLSSIALPAISTGAFGFPVEACAQIMLRVAIDYTFEDLKHLNQIVLCLFGEYALNTFSRELERKLEL